MKKPQNLMENLKKAEIPGNLKKDGNTSQNFKGQNVVKKAKVSTFDFLTVNGEITLALLLETFINTTIFVVSNPSTY